MVYEFYGEDSCDDLVFSTTMLVEKYELGLSIESQCISRFVENNKKHEDNEVTVFLTHEQAIELKDYLNKQYK